MEAPQITTVAVWCILTPLVWSVLPAKYANVVDPSPPNHLWGDVEPRNCVCQFLQMLQNVGIFATHNAPPKYTISVYLTPPT